MDKVQRGAGRVIGRVVGLVAAAAVVVALVPASASAAALSLSINDVSVTEGNSGTVAAVFTVTLSGGSPGPKGVSVNYATADQTAVAPGDYQAASGVLSFVNGGSTSQTITVSVQGDTVYEANQTFVVNLSNGVRASISDPQGIGTIVDDEAKPAFSINDAQVAEGNGGTTNMTFTVSLSGQAEASTSVNYATSDGTATAGSDYVAASGTLTFPGLTTSKALAVAVKGDTVYEGNETFVVNLASPSGATIADAQAVGTILDDESAATFSIADASTTEGNSGTKTLSFTVTLSPPTTQTVTVDYATADGTATAGSDYVAASGTLTFAPGDATKTVGVTINGDVLGESNETFKVTLSNANPSAISIARAQAVGTIQDDDGPSSLAISDASATEGNSGTKTFSFTVSMSPARDSAVTVDYATADGTATAGSDYLAKSGTLTFAPGDTTKTISVTVNGDVLGENDETFKVNLSNASGTTIADAQGVGTILDDEGASSIAISDASITEGNSGTKTLSFTVSMSPARDSAVTVDYATADGTATAGSDYVAKSGTLTFNPTDTTKAIGVTIDGDVLGENDETFKVNLSNANGATIADAQAIGTIVDDEGPSSLSIADVSAPEGDVDKTLTFTVTLTPARANTVTVDYATADATASSTGGMSPADYGPTSGTLTFATGDTSKTIAVTIYGDQLGELDETFSVDLSNASGASLAGGHAVGTIVDDDGPSSISVANESATEGTPFTTTAMPFTVSMSRPRGQAVTVDYEITDGTATVNSDYLASTPGTLTFNPGDQTATVTVTVLGDGLGEPNETLTLTLSNIQDPTAKTTFANGQSADGATGTIIDDDPSTVSVGSASIAEGNSGTKSLSFTVTLSPARSQTVSVDYTTADGTATAGTDYTAASGTLTFAPGDVTRTVSVTVPGDSTYEPDETLSVRLSNPTNASVAGGTGTGTIVNDDKQPTSITVALKSKTKKALTFRGYLTPDLVGATVQVTVSRRTSTGKWQKVASHLALLGAGVDPDGDGIYSSPYTARFKNPGKGSYRVMVVFPGDSKHMGCKASRTFRV